MIQDITERKGQGALIGCVLKIRGDSSARLDAVEIAIDIDLQQYLRVVSRSARNSRDSTVETQIDQVEFVDEDVDYTRRFSIADVVVEAFGK